MALESVAIDADVDYVLIRANNAQEMQAALNQWLADNPALYVWDIDLNGGGAAPRFSCALTVGAAVGTGFPVQASGSQFLVRGGMGTPDAVANAEAMKAYIAAEAGSSIYKVVSAGGGAGPNWMAVALTS